jgi:hypothetical protein
MNLQRQLSGNRVKRFSDANDFRSRPLPVRSRSGVNREREREREKEREGERRQ